MILFCSALVSLFIVSSRNLNILPCLLDWCFRVITFCSLLFAYMSGFWLFILLQCYSLPDFCLFWTSRPEHISVNTLCCSCLPFLAWVPSLKEQRIYSLKKIWFCLAEPFWFLSGLIKCSGEKYLVQSMCSDHDPQRCNIFRSDNLTYLDIPDPYLYRYRKG